MMIFDDIKYNCYNTRYIKRFECRINQMKEVDGEMSTGSYVYAYIEGKEKPVIVLSQEGLLINRKAFMMKYHQLIETINRTP